VQVSFVIPLLDNLALTRVCVDSLRATLPAALTHEIILVDDGSTDGTRAWLATLATPFRVVLNDRNLGYATANNRAAALARGEFLALLNNDLVLLPRWLEPMLAAHRALGPRAGLVGNLQLDARTAALDHAGIVINHQCKPVHDRTPPSHLERVLRPTRRVPAVTGACLLIERALWQQLGGFDEAFVNGGEDIDLCFRARAVGRVNAVALRSVVRHHISQSANRKLRDEENSFRLARRWGDALARAARAPLLDWCRSYHEQALAEPRDAERALARRAWLYANRVSPTPPLAALAAMHTALEIEFDRWEKLFLPARVPTPASRRVLGPVTAQIHRPEQPPGI
jgi:GT2 family glycosyltransferase